MKLTINRQEIDLQNIEFYNWYHLIDWLLRNQIDNRQGIVEMTVDGRSCRHILSDLNAEPFPAHIDLIEITTQDAYAISQSGLDKMLGLLTNLQADLPRITALFRAGNLPQGSASLGRFVQSLIPMIDFFNSISQNFDIDFSAQFIRKDMTMKELLSQLQEFFETLTKAQERSDSIELADLLEFEMSPLLTNWRQAVEQLQLILPKTAIKAVK